MLGLDWYIGDNIEINAILTSPTNPGPVHNYDNNKYAILHKIVHAYISVEKPDTNLWITEGTALYQTNGGLFYKGYLNSMEISSYSQTEGKDINLIFDLSNGTRWSLNGKDITGSSFSNIDLGVKMNSNAIPESVIKKVAGAKQIVQVSLDHSGDFGCTIYLNIEVSSNLEGLYANRMHYSPTSQEFEYTNSVVAGLGEIIWMPYTHASDYAIVIDDKLLKPEETPAKDGAVETGDSVPVLWLFAIMLISSGAIVITYKKRRK